MATKVTMPEMGESITEGTLVRWFKTVGDQVEKDEPLFEVSTYKPAGSLQVEVEVDVMSPAAGVLLEIFVKEGETTSVNTVVAEIEDEVGKVVPVEWTVAHENTNFESTPFAARADNTSNPNRATFPFFWLVVFAIAVWFLLPSSWTDPIGYSMEYNVERRAVEWSSRPTDCDWGRAPLGSKGCHFKKTVAAFNAAGDMVGGDDAPRYDQDTTGKPIISWDNGKTWDWYRGAVTPDLKVASVVVGWIKVTD